MNDTSQVEKFILTELAGGRGRRSIPPDEDLIRRGVLDSLGLMQLVSFLEERFRIQVGDEDLVADNFQSLNQIGAFVTRKSEEAPRPGNGAA
jgi:acyl carrier protein